MFWTKLAATIAVAGSLVASASAFAQTGLRFSSFEPPVAFITKDILTPWAQRVSEASNGTLKIDMYPGGTLGRDPAGQLKLVLDGVVDIAWVVPGYTPGRFDDLQVVEIPFLVENTVQGSVALSRLLDKGKLRGFEGLKVIGLFATPPNEIHTTFPVKTPEDLKGRKLRAAGPTQLLMLQRMGATPVGGISGPQIAENIQRGVIEGALIEWNALSSFRVGEAAFEHLRIPLGSVALMVVMNKARYDGLPPAAKAAIDASSGVAFARQFGMMLDQRNAEVAESVSKTPKHRVAVPDDATRQVWRAAVADVESNWVGQDASRAALVAAFKAEVEAVRRSN